MKHMIPIEISSGDRGRQKLLRGVSKMASVVGSTMGAAGRTVIIERDDMSLTRGMTVTKDGVTAAKSVVLPDPVENIACRILRESAEQTADRAGDGTTTSIVIANAMLQEASRQMRWNRGLNISDLNREISRWVDIVCRKIEGSALEMTVQRMIDVATISSNNDEKIGKVIGQAYEAVGKDGKVFYEKSKDSNTYYEDTTGIMLERGWTNRGFINNQATDECVMEDVYILLTNIEMSQIFDIEMILKFIAQQGKNLLIVGPCSQALTQVLAANKIRKGLKVCQVEPPEFGYKQKEVMEDLSAVLGGVFFSENTGNDLTHADHTKLARASKVVVGRSKMSIIPMEGATDAVGERVNQLKLQREQKGADKGFLDRRIASLTGGMATIYVGGDTDIEQKELYDRVEDAVLAVGASMEMGIVAGGGVAMRDISIEMFEHLHRRSWLDRFSQFILSTSSPRVVASKIVMAGMIAPHLKILDNAGLSPVKSQAKNFGIDVRSKQRVDMFDAGIVDPAKVTIEALRNATSVATTMIATDNVITLMREGDG